MTPGPASKTAHQLRISIEGIEPPVWRRVLVPSSMSLPRLHQVIQELFGWWDYHLHEYVIDGRRYAMDPDDVEWGEPPLAEQRVKLATVAPERRFSFVYLYDFGDHWEHRIDVEDVVPFDPAAPYPRCTGGERSRPPEDVGGVGGYTEFLDAINDPTHDEHDQCLTWVGGSFDPDACDLLDINARLTPIRKR
jgi:hypothetical protein